MEETIAVLRQWISTNMEQNLRHDYQELAVTILVFLDTTKANTKIIVKAPRAIHNTRGWQKLYIRQKLFHVGTSRQMFIQKKN